MKYTDLCAQAEVNYKAVSFWPEHDPNGMAKLITLRENVPDLIDAIRELEAERDKYEALALLNLQENATHISRAEAAEAKVAELTRESADYYERWNDCQEKRMAAEAKVARLEGALRGLHHAVCGETGFAACVRLDSGKAYPWPALDAADDAARAALTDGGKDG